VVDLVECGVASGSRSGGGNIASTRHVVERARDVWVDVEPLDVEEQVEVSPSLEHEPLRFDVEVSVI
jgi:hypothetical protein